MVGKFPIIFKRASVYDIAFCSVFDDNNSKLVVSKNHECHFEVLRVSSNVGYVPKRYRGNETRS